MERPEYPHAWHDKSMDMRASVPEPRLDPPADTTIPLGESDESNEDEKQTVEFRHNAVEKLPEADDSSEVIEMEDPADDLTFGHEDTNVTTVDFGDTDSTSRGNAAVHVGSANHSEGDELAFFTGEERPTAAPEGTVEDLTDVNLSDVNHQQDEDNEAIETLPEEGEEETTDDDSTFGIDPSIGSHSGRSPVQRRMESGKYGSPPSTHAGV